MHLFLVQHGIAKSEAEDPERPLTEEGADAVRRMGAWAVGQGLVIDQVRHSGKLRAAETAEILAGYLGPAEEPFAVPGLGPMDDVRPVADGLGDEGGPIMVVGHLPFLARLAGLLLAGSADATPVAFTNAGIVCLERGAEGWRVEWIEGTE
ncbi:MAG: phosphohistidine phosphatase SixA [Longimicrobiales bacterium]